MWMIWSAYFECCKRENIQIIGRTWQMNALPIFQIRCCIVNEMERKLNKWKKQKGRNRLRQTINGHKLKYQHRSDCRLNLNASLISAIWQKSIELIPTIIYISFQLLFLGWPIFEQWQQYGEKKKKNDEAKAAEAERKTTMTTTTTMKRQQRQTETSKCFHFRCRGFFQTYRCIT